MSASTPGPRLFLICGPNGAGKTTYAFAHIRAVAGSAHFVNLYEIARGLSPLDPLLARLRAARVALKMTRDFIRARVTFSIETTLAGKTHLRTLEAARAAGYGVTLLYFAALSPEVCLSRVARRVSEGGHDIPEADLRRRFARSLDNLPGYAGLADIWRVFDVAGAAAKVVAEGRAGCLSMRAANGALPPALTRWLGLLPACAE